MFALEVCQSVRRFIGSLIRREFGPSGVHVSVFQSSSILSLRAASKWIKAVRALVPAEALKALQDYLLESTIWSQVKFGHVGPMTYFRKLNFQASRFLFIAAAPVGTIPNLGQRPSKSGRPAQSYEPEVLKDCGRAEQR